MVCKIKYNFAKEIRVVRVLEIARFYRCFKHVAAQLQPWAFLTRVLGCYIIMQLLDVCWSVLGVFSILLGGY